MLDMLGPWIDERDAPARLHLWAPVPADGAGSDVAIFRPYFPYIFLRWRHNCVRSSLAITLADRGFPPTVACTKSGPVHAR